MPLLNLPTIYHPHYKKLDVYTTRHVARRVHIILMPSQPKQVILLFLIAVSLSDHFIRLEDRSHTLVHTFAALACVPWMQFQIRPDASKG